MLSTTMLTEKATEGRVAALAQVAQVAQVAHQRLIGQKLSLIY